jgi:hypothetical protein
MAFGEVRVFEAREVLRLCGWLASASGRRNRWSASTERPFGATWMLRSGWAWCAGVWHLRKHLRPEAMARRHYLAATSSWPAGWPLTGRVATVTRAAAPLPSPDVEVTARADPDKARRWWDDWDKLAPVERSRPAPEVLAETRDSDST